ncbi:MAG TPA: EAL domain-containing protein, partial [Longimicrobiales bacterium]|nr:EAL domain-containing protein [Longimicrobiales bacterium]
MCPQPENLSLAASIFAAVVPRFRGGPRPDGEAHALAPALSHAGTVLVVADAGGVVRHVSPNARPVLGDACERAAEFRLTLAELVQPERASDVDALVARFGLTPPSQSFTLELLTKAPSGAPRWLELWCCNLSRVTDIAGFLLEIRDVTPRRTDQTLRTLLTASLQALAESVMVTDAAGVIQYVNPSFERLTGYSAGEVIGRTPALLNSGKHRPDFFEHLWRTIADGRVYRSELVNRRKNGELYHEEIVITPITDTAGAIVHYASVGRDITHRKSEESETEDRAFYDVLTGLSHARLLRERSRQILALAKRHGHAAALLHLDLNGLRSVNEGLGRAVGDEVLRRVAERVRQGLRDSDAVARLGGDEFIVLLSEVEDEAAAARVVRRIRDAIGTPFKIQEHTINVSVSIGVALCPQDATTYEELAERAERAVNRARAAAGRVEFFQRELTEVTNERLALEDDLRWAWERRHFVLHYQPILDLANRELVGLEALTRWPHIERGLVDPSLFIPVAERTGRIVALDRWAIAAAIGQAASWAGQGWRGWVSVNLSARCLVDSDLPRYIQTCLDQHKIAAGRLAVEITESAAMRDVEATARLLRQLRDAGVLIALDNFGAGHAGLAHLKYFPVDLLKLDPSFIQDIGFDAKFEPVTEMIIHLAHQMGARVVADGVEENDQMAWLRHAGCDYAQGDLIGHSGPADSVNPLDRPA